MLVFSKARRLIRKKPRATMHRPAKNTFDCGVCGCVVIECMVCDRLVCNGCDPAKARICRTDAVCVRVDSVVKSEDDKCGGAF